MDFSSNHSCNYYPFGMEMPGRTYTNATLTQTRFGFNGQETVDEISGKGNHNTALFWEYDTRLGRRWNLDPVDQVSISNYAVLGNNPIRNIDIQGDDFVDACGRTVTAQEGITASESGSYIFNNTGSGNWTYGVWNPESESYGFNYVQEYNENSTPSLFERLDNASNNFGTAWGNSLEKGTLGNAYRTLDDKMRSSNLYVSLDGGINFGDLTAGTSVGIYSTNEHNVGATYSNSLTLKAKSSLTTAKGLIVSAINIPFSIKPYVNLNISLKPKTAPTSDDVQAYTETNAYFINRTVTADNETYSIPLLKSGRTLGGGAGVKTKLLENKGETEPVSITH